jgi:hypothetical protein
MGLDMYAYVANNANDQDSIESVNEELAYWRKHPNLHGWMEKLAKSKNLKYDTFNGVELELTFDDIMQLEKDIHHGNLPSTTGFFFGDASDEYYKEQDLDFVYEAKSRLFLGQRVFYNSSW